MILDDIIEYKQLELKQAKQSKPFNQLMKELEKKDIVRRDFFRALKREKGTGMHLIAEVKKASPSQGIIREDFEPVQIARTYSEAGADAISILTDKKFFQGDLSYIGQIRKYIELPLLRKDFTIDEYQIWEAANAGADAILLIVAALQPKVLKSLYETATGELNLAVLVEAHTKDEALQALDIGAQIIGINNRDLKTFHVDLSTTLDIRPLIPSTCVMVSESGIKTKEDIQRLTDLEVDGVLIGETFMRSKDITSKINELFG